MTDSLSTYANSWYQVAWSEEVPQGTIKSLHCFERNLVIFRGEDGCVHVLDAYCPHLGAHLGVGGKVIGNNIRCPFHAWCFNGEGMCVEIPYAKKIPARAKIKSWPTTEIHGMIFIYYHAEGKPPEFTIPPFPQYKARQWTKYCNITIPLQTNLQEMNENIFDDAHFVYIHRYGEFPKVHLDFSGPIAQVDHLTRGKLPGCEVKAEVKTSLYGAAYHISHVKTSVCFMRYLKFDIEFIVLVMKTPVTKKQIIEKLSITIKKKFFLVNKFMQKILITVICKDAMRDKKIWENKIYQSQPVLCSADASIPKFRRWHAQFYSQH